MICARDGSIQEDHMTTSKQWVEQICRNGLAIYPFDAAMTNLRKEDSQEYVRKYKDQSVGTLKVSPTDLVQARGVLGEYISGSLNWYRWRTEEQVRKSKEFRELDVNNFRTNAAKYIRDTRFDKGRFGFIHQAFRYRGKANYREALFLAYGSSTNSRLDGFTNDLCKVAFTFINMTSAYCAVSLGPDQWNAFVRDVEANRSFSKPVFPPWNEI